MKTIAFIPARYAATRFPGKLMQMLGNKTIIRHTYENTVNTLLFDEVIVVTDSEIIFNEIVHYGGYAIMSKQQHESGSDRIAEAVADIEVDIVVNVQGDEPFVKKELLKALLKPFENDVDERIKVASLMHSTVNEEIITNPNHVKVVVDQYNNALLFSRSVIPFHRDKNITPVYYKHIGIYAFRKKTLMDFTQWNPTPLETCEKLEQLRYLENGMKIKMVQTDESPISIDTQEDLELARKLI
ncbi:MAG TPA: 3-deoxy-manno-octulosonate cytidylyltransferase [Hanamia sp.]|jgi:3-deoxy-manno-octulosonate cytidylyltransferase (CMP-KDO synthetase)|nr:3-deoxy-manno-octulosonate cytidylyltransferase [Hanamia sp.]